MQLFSSALSLILLAATAVSAATVSGITGANCNGYIISTSAIQQAAQAALNHLNDGTTVGSNNYPHRYNNYEGFTFNSGCRAPFYEFPVFKSYVYTGGSAGLDRVVLGSWDGNNAVYCDAITHSGASGNAFNLCSNT